MEEKLIKSLKQEIYKQTHVLINKYKLLDGMLKTLDANDELADFIRFSTATTAFYDRKFPGAAAINLNVCKMQQEPILGLNKIEQAFDAAEQGFFHLYPDEAFHQKIKRLFKSTEAAYEKLNECLAKVEK
ncbi:MAG: hypothetical protein RLZZ628_685 [Bacteroidota bacterium]|jgi:hypothetical protein